ncbi:Uncharacterized protein FKW44_009290 [Caligus rogercresseyi]|uniref:Uncharacterized protein n=1 Tax=Caligus rogercresseyi TaxID=217165 RepID=A0A7T8K7D9_CALRO|nr:Uncharacterized protein FKW44_009290 [Caligus rogercresseyi]
MFLESDVRIRVHVLLEAGKTPKEILRQLGISRPTVYKVKATGIERKVRSGAKKSLDREEVKQILMVDPLKSIRAHAADMGVPHSTLALAVKNSGGKSFDLWAPQSSYANPLDYAFWPHIESKAYKLRHPKIASLKAAVNQE